MTRCTWTICRLFVCGLLGCCLTLTGAALAADSKAPAATAAPSEEEMMAAIMKLAAPGPQHAALKAFVGSWKTVSKAWDPAGKLTVTEGTSESAMMLGDRFIKDEFHGSMMGQPFEGFGITGYDNARKQYVSVWMDSWGTQITSQTGTMDASGKMLTMNGTWEDPMTHEKAPTKMVTKIVNDTTHVFSMYNQVEGKDHLEMGITYTRR